MRHLTKQQQETLDAVKSRRFAPNRLLAQDLDIPLATCHMRLKKLLYKKEIKRYLAKDHTTQPIWWYYV